MPDSGPGSERDLERELRDLGSHIEYPQTPGLARAARQRLEAEANEHEERTARRGRFWLPALSPRWAVAAMFVIVLAIPVLSPAARQSLSGLFIVGDGASSGPAQSVEDAAAGDAAGKSEPRDMVAGEPEAQQASAGAEEVIPESASGGQAATGEQATSDGQMRCLHCGDNIEKYAKRITLREARTRGRDGRPVLLPWATTSDKPDAVYRVESPSGTGRTGLAFLYQARPELPAFGNTEVGMVLTELPGDLGSTYLRGGPNKALFEAVNVGGRRGYWSPQWPAYWVPGLRRGPSSMPSPTESVLLWEQEGISLRLESNLTREQAIRIAESVR
ncbi:MAG: DUF4367 domain-containing protein [Actinomycetota bacterium]|jgi:hypothetical protein|nr:DUF4367 domain-containing protein [Actinomycetota bacterium]